VARSSSLDPSDARHFERLDVDPDGLSAAIASQHDDALRAVGEHGSAARALRKMGVERGRLAAAARLELGLLNG
jgi:hypothetical protein